MKTDTIILEQKYASKVTAYIDKFINDKYVTTGIIPNYKIESVTMINNTVNVTIKVQQQIENIAIDFTIYKDIWRDLENRLKNANAK